MKQRREQLLNRKWLAMNKQIAFTTIVGCSKTNEP